MAESEVRQESLPCEMYYSTDRSKAFYPAFHAHEFYEVYLFLQGEATFIVEDYEHAMIPGDLMIVPPGKFHRATFSDLELPYERLLAYVGREMMEQIRLPGFSVAEHLEQLASRRAYCVHLPPEEQETWTQLFREAGKLPSLPAAQQLSIFCRLSGLLARLCSQEQERLPAASDGVVGRVIAYINAHYRNELTIQQLGQRFYLTPNHLSRIFQQYAQISIHQYITAKRMQLACALLRQGMAPQEVAASCGYRDYSCFYRAFVKYAGCSPAAYRKQG